MATFTTNCKLHQWEPEDNFLRTDFNEDFSKIDAAIGKKADSTSVDSKVSALSGRLDALDSRTYYAVGTYEGNGAFPRDIYLGFAPKAVLLENPNGTRTVNGGLNGGLAVTGNPLMSGSETALEVTATGFRVSSTSSVSYLNVRGRRYSYIAFK